MKTNSNLMYTLAWPTSWFWIFLVVTGTAIPLSILVAQPVIPPAELITRVTNAYPAFSPDGAKITYMSNADGDFDIYVLHLNKEFCKN